MRCASGLHGCRPSPFCIASREFFVSVVCPGLQSTFLLIYFLHIFIITYYIYLFLLICLSHIRPPQAPTGVSLLECNFDIGLLTVFEEMRYFHRLGFMPPPAATEMLPKEERLRIFRENVCVVVRHYNHIVNLLSPDERRLFTERIAFLDKKFAPGLNKLFWSSKGIVEYFVRDCRKFSRGEQQTVDEFKVLARAWRCSVREGGREGGKQHNKASDVCYFP